MTELKKTKKKQPQTDILGNISQKSGIPLDMLTRRPFISLNSNREITIEDAGKLENYDSSCVSLYQKDMLLTVCGKELQLKFLSGGNVGVSGIITGLYLGQKPEEDKK